MTLKIAQLEALYPWFLAFVRVLTIVLLAPIFGTRSLPWQGRVGLAFFMALALAPLVPAGAGPRPGGILDFGLDAIREVVIGVAFGLTANLIFSGVQMAGTLVGYQVGFGIVNVMDPQSENQISVIGQFEYLLAVIIFLAINGHHLIVSALAESFRVVPLGGAGSLELFWTVFTRRSGDIFLIGLKLGAPAIVSLIAITAALGFMARPVPQLNVFGVGFPVQIAIGMVLTAVSLPFFDAVFRGAVADLPAAFNDCLHVFAHP